MEIALFFRNECFIRIIDNEKKNKFMFNSKAKKSVLKFMKKKKYPTRCRMIQGEM